MKKLYQLLFLFAIINLSAQVGINTTTPNAQLEIKSSNQVTPANTDGIIIPKVDAFPGTNPTANQHTMLVYLTTTVGLDTPGFYYWDNNATVWTPLSKGGTLDNAYDFGTPGNGKTIAATDGAVLIEGEDGMTVTGTFGVGESIAATGPGTRMFFNPKKAAFRAGFVNGTQWDDANLANFSIAMGGNSEASGDSSIAIGNGCVATGTCSTAIGYVNSTPGFAATAMGLLNTSSGDVSFTAGYSNKSRSFAETTFGVNAIDYAPINASAFSADDRIFTIGNGTSDTARSNAFTILKNANTIIGGDTPKARLEIKASNQVSPSNTDGIIIPKIDAFPLTNPTIAQNAMMVYLTTASGTNIAGFYYWENATASWKRINAAAGTLDAAYDFGGAGNGRSINATDGAVLINGNDGLAVTGNFLSGGEVPVSGSGARMFYNPRRAAFRAGFVNATQWDAANVGFNSVGFGFCPTASAFGTIAMGANSIASGSEAIAMGSYASATGNYATAFGPYSIAESQNETVVGCNNNLAISPSPAAWVGTDRIFTVGNGQNQSLKSNAFTILKNGNTGIGTTQPNAQLQLSNAVQNRKVVLFENSNNDHQFFGFGINTGTLRYQVPNTTDNHIFYAGVNNISSNEIMRIQGNGNVGVGVTTVNEKFEVGGIVRARGYSCRNGTGGTYSGNVFNYNWTGAALQMWIDNVYIGTVNVTSDRRLKSDIVNLKEDAISRIMQLHPVSFKYKNIPETIFSGSDTINEGFIADELQSVIPSAVNGQKEGITSDGKIQPQTLNIMPIVSVLTKAIQEQQKQIEKQENENSQLRKEIQKILERLILLEEKIKK